VSPVEHGGYTLEGWWLATAGVALGVLAAGLGTRWQKASSLAGLLVLGAAAPLALTQQHWLQYLDPRPGRLATLVGTVSLAVLLLQTTVVSALLWRHGRLLWRGIAALLTPVRAFLAAVLFAVCAAHATLVFVAGGQWTYVVLYLGQIAAIGGLVILNIAHLFLVVRALPEDLVTRAWRRIGDAVTLPGTDRPKTRIDRLLPWMGALFVFAVSAFMALVVLERTPHIQDEVAYLFQAKCLAEGLLTASPPPEPEAFSYYLLTVADGRWYGVMNPGWPMVLALGVALGATWLVNPLIAALTVLVIHTLTRRLADRGTANLLTLLLAVSPWFLLISGSLMAQTLALLLVSCALLLVLRAARRRTWVAALLGGACLGLIFLNRPLDAVIVSAAIGAAVIGFAKARLRPVAWLALIVGAIATGAWQFPYNAHITGDPLVFPMNEYFDRVWYPGANRLGFGADVGNSVPRWTGLDPLPGHGPVDVALNANQNLYNINVELFGWPVGSLVLAVIFLLRGRWSRMDRAWALFILAVVAAYSLYWFSGGPDYGARYWYLALYPLLWFTVRGLRAATAVLRKRFPDVVWEPRMAAAVALLVLLSITTFVPWRMAGKYPAYRDAYPDYQRLVESGAIEGGLVLVRTDSEVEFGPALLLNSPRLGENGVVFARDMGAASNRRLSEYFGVRSVYRVKRSRVGRNRSEIVSVSEPALPGTDTRVKALPES
jgi:4-amino-4-deoxy-L-arabinose transferase-like glycosyltransferase